MLTHMYKLNTWEVVSSNSNWSCGMRMSTGLWFCTWQWFGVLWLKHPTSTHFPLWRGQWQAWDKQFGRGQRKGMSEMCLSPEVELWIRRWSNQSNDLYCSCSCSVQIKYDFPLLNTCTFRCGCCQTGAVLAWFKINCLYWDLWNK